MLKRRCRVARDLNSDRYDRSQNTDINNSPTRYHSTMALTAFCCLQFSMYLAAERCARWAWRARGGVRAVGMACARWAWRHQHLFSVIKNGPNTKSKRSKCSGLAISRRIQIYAMIGVELRTHGEIFVQS